jgi:hypothetical protein
MEKELVGFGEQTASRFLVYLDKKNSFFHLFFFHDQEEPHERKYVCKSMVCNADVNCFFPFRPQQHNTHARWLN